MSLAIMGKVYAGDGSLEIKMSGNLSPEFLDRS